MTAYNPKHPYGLSQEPGLEMGQRKAVVNLLEIDPIDDSNPDVRLIKERIKGNNGIIRIVMHSFFERSEGAIPNDPREEALIRSLQQLVTTDTAQKTPVVVFEEQIDTINTQTILSRWQQGQKHSEPSVVYLVPTYTGDPDPKFTPSSQGYVDDGVDRDENWARFVNLLSSLGVKKIMLGGARLMSDQFRTDERFQENGKAIEGCVNHASHRLSGQFAVEISYLSYPATRTETGPKL